MYLNKIKGALASFKARFSHWSIWKKIALISSLMAGAGIFILIVFFSLVYYGHFNAIPSYSELRNIRNNVASEVYSVEGQLIGKYYYQERTHTPFDEISPYLIKALLATEDIRFYQHDGIDYRSLARVFFKTILFQDESSGGGSTITLQLAKNLYPRKDFGIITIPVVKTREAFIAHRLENVYSKKEIIELYLNTVSFGDSAFGIQTASERFFNCTPAELNLQEAAVLVGMLKATHTYNPRTNPDLSINRRNTVLGQMAKYNFISDIEFDSVQTLPLALEYRNTGHNEGLATYFREQLRQELPAILQEIKKPDGSAYNIYTDGLKIYTTIHNKLQRYAEEANHEHMKRLQKTFDMHWSNSVPWRHDRRILLNAIYSTEKYQMLKEKGLAEEKIQDIFKEKKKMTVFSYDGEVEKEMSSLDSIKYYLRFLNSGFLAMEPSSGEVLAWVGGIDHKYFKYDHVNINTKRQVGSTFKPIVYAAALENGMDPCEYIANQQHTYEEYEDWSPENSDGNYEGYYSMQGALTNSVNTISVDLLLRTGIDHAVSLAHQVGIESKIPEVPSIALGTPSVSLMEMVSAYCTFANKGKIVKPRYLLKIEDNQGNILYENKTANPKKSVISSQTAEMMLQMMQSVVNEGTAARLRYHYGLFNDIAGKTGTTQNQSDGWFIGITPNLVAGAWVGADDPGIRFRTTALGQGAATALPIWGLFMQKVNSDRKLVHYSKARFPKPRPEVMEKLNCDPFVMEKEDDAFDLWDIFKKRSEQDGPRYPDRKAERKSKEKKKKKGFFGRLLDDIFK